MEKILMQIVHEIGTLNDEVGSLNTTVTRMRDELGSLNTTVTRMRDEHGKKLDEHGKKLNEHGRRLENLEVSMSGMKDEHGKMLNEYGRRLENLEVSMSGMKDEHGLMLRAILESKDVQRGEIDNLQHQSALLTGTLKRAANQIAEDLQEAK